MASAAEAKLAALFIATHKMVPHQQTLIDMGWLQPRLGIPIFGSNFWDPHRKRYSNSVFDSGYYSFFLYLLLKSHQIGIPIPKIGIPNFVLGKDSIHLS